MRATRLRVANYNKKLSSDSLETGTGSSNSPRSTIQSVLVLLGETFEIRACARDFRLHMDLENGFGGADRGNAARPIRHRFC